jgi:succinate dehydrogenase / fumarate reductase iron-sulfur subunit
LKLKLRIWRQANATATGRLVDYVAGHVSPDMSFLEMLDVVNEGLSKKGEDTNRVRFGLPRRHLRHVQPRS